MHAGRRKRKHAVRSSPRIFPLFGAAGGRGVHAEDGIKGRHREVGVEAERHIPLLGAGDRVHAQRAFADESVTVQVAPHMHMPERKKLAMMPSFRHTVELFLGRHLAMDEHVPGVRAGIGRLRLLYGVDGFLDGVVAVGMDGDLASAPGGIAPRGPANRSRGMVKEPLFRRCRGRVP